MPTHTGRRRRLTLECLDPRCLPSAGNAFLQTNLVSDQPGIAAHTDPNLVNAWGLAVSNPGPTFWVSDNHSDKASVYSGDVRGSPFVINPLVVSIPGGAPTGQVFNTTNDFVVTDGTHSAKAIFIFASESGQITGWNPAVPPPPPSNQAQPGAGVPGANFKGLAIGTNTNGSALFASDFTTGRIFVFDGSFHQETTAGDFT